MLKKIHVYDLDGVLVDSSHRYRNKPDGTIDLDYWIANRTPEKINADKVLPLHRQYISDCIDPETYTVICTSRLYNAADIEYIVSFLGIPDKLIMRPEDNTDGDAVLKYRQLSRFFNLKQFRTLPKFLWEDNLKNIRALLPLFTRAYHIKSNQGA